MRVIHTVPCIANEASGPSYSVRRLCESLLEQGQEVTLATLDPLPQSEPLFLKGFPRGAGPARLGRSPEMRQWLFNEAKSERVDLIHNHSLWMMPNVYPSAVARKHKVPLVVAPRGTFSAYAFHSGSIVKRVFWPLIQRPALTAVTCFHATAESECADIRRMGFRQPVAIIPNGIDIPLYLRAPDTPVRTILYVGRLHREKGLELLLKAWQAVFAQFPNWQLRIVGPDVAAYRTTLSEMVQSLGLRRVIFAGPHYGVDKHTAYSEAELFVLPSPSENFGVAVAEALASGTPAIVTRGAPWAGLAREDAGWWVEVKVEALVAALCEALSHSPRELERRGQRGRQWMIREFSWQSVGQRMSHCYDWILNGGEIPSFVVAK